MASLVDKPLVVLNFENIGSAYYSEWGSGDGKPLNSCSAPSPASFNHTLRSAAPSNKSLLAAAGQSESNLQKVLDAVAAMPGAILFVDEAEAIFPSRCVVTSAVAITMIP